MSVSLKIADMLPMVCHFVTRIVPRVNVGGLITNHREHTCYFQKVGTKREKT
ncbi:hypothetical protein Hanom_Chr08g00687671 [Helianthus anomalus]